MIFSHAFADGLEKKESKGYPNSDEDTQSTFHCHSQRYGGYRLSAVRLVQCVSVESLVEAVTGRLATQ